MNQGPNFGCAYVVSATGALCITSADSQILGILFQGSATGSLQIWAGTTATATSAGAPLSYVIKAFSTTGSVTAQNAVYYPFPAYASGGITINVPGTNDPKLTLFWNPIS